MNAMRQSMRQSVRRRAGFTIVEMLAVIGVLAVLMGLLFPAVQRAAQRARDVADKDLVVQVANAWTLLAQENKRLPSAELIAESLQNSGHVDDSTPFDMEPGPSCILNWWEAIRPSAKGDKKAFFDNEETRPKYAVTGGGVKKGDSIDRNEIKNGGGNFMYWPPDMRLERTTDQKAIGIFPSWVARAISRGLANDELVADGFEPEEKAEDAAKNAKDFFARDEKCKDHGLVKVMLDFDGDGQIKVPGDYTESGSDETVYATAVAFVFTEDGTRVIRSW